MIVAETLGVPLERVEVLNSDTAVKPWDVGAHASRTTFIAGNAARLAAEKLRGQLLAMAAPELEAPVEQLRAAGGWIFVDDEPQRRIAYDRAARAGHLRMHGQTLVAEAFYDPPTAMLDKDLRGNVSATYGFAAQAVVLDVELATGVVRVRRIISAHDVGRALNPLAAEGQIHGGVHMGLGYALSERLVVQEGQVLTASFMDYAILKAADMPEIVVRLIETGDPEGPFGAKGLGESGVIPVSAAVANAVKDAIGVRFTELPITAPSCTRRCAAAERAREALRGRAGARSQPHAGRALRLDAAGRHGRRGHQDRGARRRRSDARHGAAVPARRRQRLLPGDQSQQEVGRARSDEARRALGVPRPRREGRHRVGELPSRHHGAARPAATPRWRP